MHTANAPQLPSGFYEYVQQEKIPVLGVCYGMQLLVHVSSPYPEQWPTCSIGIASAPGKLSTL